RHPPTEGDPVTAGVEPEDLDSAARRSEQVEHAADRRRLAGSVRAEETEHLAPPDFQIDSPDRMDAAGVLHEAGDPERGHLGANLGPWPLLSIHVRAG